MRGEALRVAVRCTAWTQKQCGAHSDSSNSPLVGRFTRKAALGARNGWDSTDANQQCENEYTNRRSDANTRGQEQRSITATQAEFERFSAPANAAMLCTPSRVCASPTIQTNHTHSHRKQQQATSSSKLQTRTRVQNLEWSCQATSNATTRAGLKLTCQRQGLKRDVCLPANWAISCTPSSVCASPTTSVRAMPPEHEQKPRW